MRPQLPWFRLAPYGGGSASLSDSDVDSGILADCAVSTAGLQDSAVTDSKIADSAVTSAKIANGTIVNADLADSAVTTVKISDSQVTYAKMQAVTGARLLGRYDAAAGVTQEVALAGGLSFDSNGATLSSDTTTTLSDSQVDSSALADSAVTSAGIQDGSITSADLGVEAADLVVGTNGDYTNIQTALDNMPSGGGVLYIEDGTYTIDSTLTIGTSRTHIVASEGAQIQCDGASVTTLIKPNSSSVSQIVVEGGYWLQTNATAQGVAFDFSNTSDAILSPKRIEEFGTAFQFNDTTNTTFYNKIYNTQIFNCNNGVAIGGTLTNANSAFGLRIRPKAGGAGTGISIVNSRGWTFTGCNVEPSAATGITGISLDSLARENTFLNCWLEGNDTGVLVISGATRNTFVGNTITGNTDDIDDTGTASMWLNTNVTGATRSQYNADFTLEGADLILSGASADIRSDTALDLYPSNQTSRGLRILDGTDRISLSVLGAGILELGDTILNLPASGSLTVDGTSILSDAAGVMTLASIDCLDTTTSATIAQEADNASLTATGVVELATAAEITTGTDTSRAMGIEGFVGSEYGTRLIQIAVTDTTLATGDSQIHFFIPNEMDSWDLVDADAAVATPSTTGNPTIQIRNATDAADMLSTKITIDTAEKTSFTALTAPVIDTANDSVVAGDELVIDIDSAGTAEGLNILLSFRKI